MMSDFSVIVVNYNTKQLTTKCIDSVIHSGVNASQIIIVDNHSSDGSVKYFKSQYPRVKIIANTQNLGFAKANNLAISQFPSRYYILLNSDTLVQPQAISRLVSFMDTHAQVGIAAPKLLGSDGQIQPNGGVLPSLGSIIIWAWFFDDLPIFGRLLPSYHLTGFHVFNSTRSIGWVSGAAMIVRRRMLNQIGLFDDQIFMYSEDTDLCLRARIKGWQIYTLAEAQVTHIGQASGTQANALAQEFKGLLYLFKKHKPSWQTTLLKLILKSAAILRLIVFGRILGDAQKEKTYRQAASLV